MTKGFRLTNKTLTEFINWSFNRWKKEIGYKNEEITKEDELMYEEEMFDCKETLKEFVKFLKFKGIMK